MTMRLKSSSSIKGDQSDSHPSDYAKVVFWYHNQNFKLVWNGGISAPQAGGSSNWQWFKFHQRFCDQHHVRDPLLHRVLAEFIQHVSNIGLSHDTKSNILQTWDAKFDAISMADDEIQHFTISYIIAHHEQFGGITDDIATNREVLRKVVAEKIPAFLEQVFTLPAPSAVIEFLNAP